MSNRDSKGRFIKRRVLLGDKVYHTYSGKSDPGVIIAIDRNKARVRWEKDSEQWNLIENLRLLEPNNPSAPQPKAEELLAAIRSATGIHASDQPDLVAAVRSIANQMDRHRQDIATLKAEVKSAQDGRGGAEAKLADIATLLRVRATGCLGDMVIFPAIQSVLDRP